MANNFPNLGKKMCNQIEDAQSTLNKRNTNKFTSRHIIIKLPEFTDKERI